MSMIQANRKKRGQSDWTVFGVLSDGETFAFYDLDMNSQYTVVYVQAKREGWQMVANMLGSLIIEGIKTYSSPMRSSLASNPSPRNSYQQTSPQLPPLGTLPSIEDMMERDMEMEMNKKGIILNLLQELEATGNPGNGKWWRPRVRRCIALNAGCLKLMPGCLILASLMPDLSLVLDRFQASLYSYMHTLLDFSTFK
ncbi:hypothetical protein VN97_g7855 [Penicillium thymicola]|uniref:Uncharacterized protein n=1 Tax=Penicillium thymicola TaxID=293382 RepID=A0AAI9TFJ9_PENTH|nr:hypothetical protein VN97_g7855 [Penicillium thymicola]